MIQLKTLVVEDGKQKLFNDKYENVEMNEQRMLQMKSIKSNK